MIWFTDTITLRSHSLSGNNSLKFSLVLMEPSREIDTDFINERSEEDRRNKENETPEIIEVCAPTRATNNEDQCTEMETVDSDEAAAIIKVHEQEKLFKISKFTLINIVILSFLYIGDVITDLYVAINLLVEGRIWFGVCSLIFVVGSSIVYNSVNKDAKWRDFKKTSRLFWVWIGPYFLLNFEPLLQMMKNFNTTNKYLKAKKEKKIKDQAALFDEFISGYRIVAVLKYNESLWEVTPQLILQVMIVSSQFLEEDEECIMSVESLFEITYISISQSFTLSGLLLTIYAYHRSFYYKLGEEPKGVPLVLSTVLMVSLLYRVWALNNFFHAVSWYIFFSCLIVHYKGCVLWSYFSKKEEDRSFLNSLANGYNLMLYPSLKTQYQFVVTNCILLACNVIFYLIVVNSVQISNSRKYAIILNCIGEAVFKCMVFYWYEKHPLYLEKVLRPWILNNFFANKYSGRRL